MQLLPMASLAVCLVIVCGCSVGQPLASPQAASVCLELQNGKHRLCLKSDRTVEADIQGQPQGRYVLEEAAASKILALGAEVSHTASPGRYYVPPSQFEEAVVEARVGTRTYRYMLVHAVEAIRCPEELATFARDLSGLSKW